VADEKIRYVLDVDDKGTPKIVKFGQASEKSGKQAEKAFEGASKGVKEFGAEIPVVGRAMSALASPAAAAGAAVAAVGLGMGVAVKRSIDFADGINDLSLRLGISTERLSVLSLYAEQSGTDIESVASAMGKLGVKLSDGDKQLKKYGITATSVDGALYQVADRIAATEDPMLRLKIATDAFGKSGQQMLPMLVQGGDALREMSDSAPIVTTEMAKMSDQFNDSTAAMAGKFRGLGLEITSALLPALQSAMDLLGGVAEKAGNLLDGKKIVSFGGHLRLAEDTSINPADAGRKGMSSADMIRELTAPKGKVGAGSTIAAEKAVAQFADAGDDPNWTFRRNQIMASRFEAAKMAAGDTGSEAQFRAGTIGAVDGAQGQSVELGDDYYAGLPISQKAQDSLFAQYKAAEGKEAVELDKRLEAQQAQYKAFADSVRGDLQSGFGAAFQDIWRNGRDVFSSLYDSFSEQFTNRAINSLATVFSNLIIPGGGGGGLLGLLGFASGGNPPEGIPSVVGERRAEAIIPQGPSRVSPVAGGGMVVNITVSNPAEAHSVARQLQRDGRTRSRGIR
jgi:hypothetical protein